MTSFDDNNTRRYPRTLQEAFGPHTERNTIITPSREEKLTEMGYRVSFWLGLAIIGIILCAAAFGS